MTKLVYLNSTSVFALISYYEQCFEEKTNSMPLVKAKYFLYFKDGLLVVFNFLC